MYKERAPQGQSYAIAFLGGAAMSYIFLRNHIAEHRLSRAEAELARLEAEKEAVKLAELAELAKIDSVTGLHNRRALEEEYQYLQDSSRHGRNRAHDVEARHSLLLIDIDKFKGINDTRGHNMGNVVLCNVANNIKSSSRKSDKPIRLHGDELADLLPGASESNALKTAEKIRQSTEQDGDVTVSIGVIELDLRLSLEENMERADVALYSAKAQGRNQVVAWSSLPPADVSA